MRPVAPLMWLLCYLIKLASTTDHICQNLMAATTHFPLLQCFCSKPYNLETLRGAVRPICLAVLSYCLIYWVARVSGVGLGDGGGG